MIIRATFHDNDYKWLLEEFFKRFKFDHYGFHIRGIEDPREYRDKKVEADDIFEKVFYKSRELTKKEALRFTKIVQQSFESYIKAYCSEDNAKYCIENLDIKLRKVCADKWENGEVLYYFINQDTYLIM